VGQGDESIVLSEREREALAGLAESIGDPWLAGQLTGHGHVPPPPKPSHRPVWQRLAASPWFGAVLVVVGALLAMPTFMHSIPAATAGLAVMGVGLWRAVAQPGARVTLRLTARRAPQG